MNISLLVPGPAYRIHTSRLVLRCLEPRDTLALHHAMQRNIDHLLPWLAWVKKEPLDLQARLARLRKWRGDFDLGFDFSYGIFDPAVSVLLSVAGSHTNLGSDARELSYWIDKGQINQGFATEACVALTKAAFEIDHVKRVEIRCNPKNTRSIAVAEKLGFTHEDTLHKRIEDAGGNLTDDMIWTLFAEDYPASPSAGAQIAAFDVLDRRIL